MEQLFAPAPAPAPAPAYGPATGSLPVRHRPRRFTDVVGQRHVSVPIRRALAAGRLPQQLLFSGGSGLGKTTLARIVAAALLCEQPVVDDDGVDACGTCRTCQDIAAGVHVDVIEFDAASNGGVDRIRDLAARAHIAPLRASHRVYIIDEAHGLTAAGGQAFLKLLEEPPAHVVFLLATTDPDKMLLTNRSRCAEFELLPPSRTAVVTHLVTVARREGVDLEPDAAATVVAAVDGDLGVRGALVALDKVLPVLSSGSVADDDLADLLGVPPGSQVQALAAAAAAGDPVAALGVFTLLRRRYPVRKITEQLATRFVADLVAVCAHHPLDPDAFAAAERRCTVLARAAAAGSEVAIVAAIADLSKPLHGAIPTFAASAPAAERPIEDAPVEAVDADGESPGPSTVAVEDPSTAPAPTDVPGDHHGTSRNDLRTLLDILAPEARLAAAILRSGTAVTDGGVLTVALPGPALARLRAFAAAVDAAAATAGVTIVLVEKTS